MNLAEPAKPSPALLSGLCRQHYATGDQASLHAAHARLSSLVISDATDAWAARRTGALVKVANGEWAEAEKEWRALVEEDASDLEVRRSRHSDPVARILTHPFSPCIPLDSGDQQPGCLAAVPGQAERCPRATDQACG